MSRFSNHLVWSLKPAARQGAAPICLPATPEAPPAEPEVEPETPQAPPREKPELDPFEPSWPPGRTEPQPKAGWVRAFDGQSARQPASLIPCT